MEQDLLIENSKKHITALAKSIAYNESEIEKIVGLTLQDKQTISARASWVISELCKSNNEHIFKQLPVIIRALPTISIDGIKRNLLCGMQCLTIDEENIGSLIDICFKFILTPSETVAVKVYSMQIIANTVNKYPEIKNELIAVIEEEMTKNSVAFYARAKKILKVLHKK